MPRDAESGERIAGTSKRERLIRKPFRSGSISVPQSFAMRKLYERLRNDGVIGTDRRDVAGRNSDDPVRGRVMVMPRDERDAKYEKPLMYADFQPGRAPLLVIGGGAEHWQDLKEMADEARHYGDDRPEIPKIPVSYEDLWKAMLERIADARAGRKTYGAAAGSYTKPPREEGGN